MNFYELFQALSSNVWLYGGTFLVVLSILVFVHEWGHYIIARLCGVRVETFSIGFGKELWGRTDSHGTRWKFSLIPLGGYVKLFGDVDPASVQHAEGSKDEKTGKIKPFTEAEKKEAFFNQPVWKRSAVVFAGPAINYIFAIFILTGLYIYNGQPVTPPLAAAIIGDSAAHENGFQPHDVIVSIDGKDIGSFEDIRREMMIALNDKKHFVIERDGKIVDIHAAPKIVEMEDRFGFKNSRGLLGLISPRHAVKVSNIKKIDGRAYKDVEAVRAALLQRMDKTFTIDVERGPKTDTLTVRPLADSNQALGDSEHENYDVLFLAGQEANIFVKHGPVSAFFQSIKETISITTGTLEALGQMITGSRSATELGGIIRIGALAGDMAKQGIIALILFTALLSINLGLINLFPIPLLDGGHLLFYAFEAVLGKPVPEQIQEYAFRLGLTFLVGIMAFANLNDLMQLIL
ncbi:MAG: zinc metalloprotease [Micavibrio sp.]|nr:MAG: zinc metalloprotease [Micavibrio sp.]